MYSGATYSAGFGYGVRVYGTCSMGVGRCIRAYSDSSIVMGHGSSTINRHLTACGNYTFNLSHTTSGLPAYGGANAHCSGIFAGASHNIASGNTGAVIIGGYSIDLVNAEYVNTTAVDNLAIMTAPSAGGSNDLLTWESGGTSTGTIRKVTQASISDEKLKTIIQPIGNALDGIVALNGYEYEFNDKVQPESMIGQKRYGLIAQEVEIKFPLVVNNNVKFDDVTYKTVEYRELVPVLVEAIKELNEKNKNLEERIIELEK